MIEVDNLASGDLDREQRKCFAMQSGSVIFLISFFFIVYRMSRGVIFLGMIVQYLVAYLSARRNSLAAAQLHLIFRPFLFTVGESRKVYTCLKSIFFFFLLLKYQKELKELNRRCKTMDT